VGGKWLMAKMHEFEHSSECDAELADVIESVMSTSLKTQSNFNLAVAGGNTPKALYQKLSLLPLNWHKIKITLTDERWVEPQHTESNENMVRQTLLKNEAKSASFIPLKSNVHDPLQAVKDCDKNLKQSMADLDVVVLGMGEDGHFASIFPNVENLESLLDLKQELFCQAVFPSEKLARMSLTLAYLLNAKTIYLRVSGSVKKQIILNILNGKHLTNDYPVASLLNQIACPVEIYWSA
jgi:6-phosphogluconolactonase